MDEEDEEMNEELDDQPEAEEEYEDGEVNAATRGRAGGLLDDLDLN
jgi:hypothetical protein